MSLTRHALLAYLLGLAVIVLDQITKAWVLYGLSLREVGRIEVLPFFNLTYVLNTGVSFGLLAGGELARWGLSAFSILVAVALAVWVRRADRPLFAVAVGLVMGGAIGNVIDRIRFGGVVDFLDFSALMFPWVFNVADAAISVGVATLLLDSVLAERRERASIGLAREKS